MPQTTDQLEPVPLPDTHAPVSDGLKRELVRLLRDIADKAWAHYERRKVEDRYCAKPDSLPRDFGARAAAWLEDGEGGSRDGKPLLDLYWYTLSSATRLIKELLEHPGLQLIHAVRLVDLFGDLRRPWDTRPRLSPECVGFLDHYWGNHAPRFSLRQLAAVLDVVGVGGDAIGETMVRSPRAVALNHDPDDTRLYFTERVHLLEEILGVRSASPGLWGGPSWEIKRKTPNAYRILGLFPVLPPHFVSTLWERALAGSPYAQQALSSVPAKEGRIIQALSSGRQEARAVAAECLRALCCRDAVPALQEAVAKEKREFVKGVMMKALEALGTPVEDLLDRDRLLDEARAGLAKGVPDSLSWLPVDAVPVVTWEDSGAAVDREVLTWFIVQSNQRKTPEPGPLLRHYCSLFAPVGREALAQFVLQSWIHHDTAPAYTRAEAEDRAATDAKQYIRRFRDVTLEELTQALFGQYVNELRGTAIREKGVLAVAAACGSGALVPIVQRYLREWSGRRRAQCKALLEMLAWIEDPAATQLLLSVATRFRTRGVREAAHEQVRLLAQRKGWTTDELADRTIPTAGLGDNGELVVECGERTYTARLDSEFRFVLRNEQGKEVKSLPSPKAAKDPDAVKEARKILSRAKKELKSLLGQQKTRLFEAMCTQRTWRHADWEQCLSRHPIVGRYCQMLVWTEVDDGGGVGQTFRPLADGTLTNAADEEVVLPDSASIALAHSTVLPPDVGQAWLQHFDDYEVAPLFAQFGGEQYALADENRGGTEIADFRGHMIEAFRLRSAAQKRGYIRGHGEEGGWFYTYARDFPSLGLRAVMGFSGNSLPEENRAVALDSLVFEAIPASDDDEVDEYGRRGGFRLPLGEVPPVLLSECYNDLRVAAAQGMGFDPDWQKKVEW